MRKPLQKCLAALKRSDGTTGEYRKAQTWKSISSLLVESGLVNWLKRFRGFEDDLSGLCYSAYRQRSCQSVRALQRHIGDRAAEAVESESRRQAFVSVRHYIGRLGCYLKAAKMLVAAGLRMPDLFDNFYDPCSPFA